MLQNYDQKSLQNSQYQGGSDTRGKANIRFFILDMKEDMLMEMLLESPQDVHLSRKEGWRFLL